MRLAAFAVTITWMLVSAVPARAADGGEEGRGEFTFAVLRLAAEADVIDRVWVVYKATCGVEGGFPGGHGREWFALWSRGALPRPGSPPCLELLFCILERGEAVRRDLIQLRGQARRAAIPGTTEEGMLRWNGLDWAQ